MSLYRLHLCHSQNYAQYQLQTIRRVSTSILHQKAQKRSKPQIWNLLEKKQIAILERGSRSHKTGIGPEQGHYVYRHDIQGLIGDINCIIMTLLRTLINSERIEQIKKSLMLSENFKTSEALKDSQTTSPQMLFLDDLTPIHVGSDFFLSGESLQGEVSGQGEPSMYLDLNGWEGKASNGPEKHLFQRLGEEVKEESISSKDESQCKNNSRRLQNDTKNIPKNYAKGIINFMQKNEKKVRQIASANRLAYSELNKMVRCKKRTINTIAQLRSLWTDPVVGKCMRVISNLFLRKYALAYVFNSRISSLATHVKYRQALWQAVGNPGEFNHIKQF